jgi:putative oxidoreductase
MLQSKPVLLIQRAYGWLIQGGTLLQHPLLLLVRLYFGWRFYLTGSGKLGDIAATVENFTGWGVPFPKLSVYLAGTTECVCGILLMAGLASRLISIPLVFTMLVAYATAHKDSLTFAIKEDDVFLGPFVDATPFVFLLVALVVLAFGPGVFSLDWLLQKKLKPSQKSA